MAKSAYTFNPNPTMNRMARPHLACCTPQTRTPPVLAATAEGAGIRAPGCKCGRALQNRAMGPGRGLLYGYGDSYARLINMRHDRKRLLAHEHDRRVVVVGMVGQVGWGVGGGCTYPY